MGVAAGMEVGVRGDRGREIDTGGGSGEGQWIYWESDRQTDRQTGCPKLSCADPSFSGNELEPAASTCLPEENTQTPRHQRGTLAGSGYR